MKEEQNKDTIWISTSKRCQEEGVSLVQSLIIVTAGVNNDQALGKNNGMKTAEM